MSTTGIRFTSDTLVPARVTVVHTFTDNINGYAPDQRPTVDVVATNGMSSWQGVPIALPPGQIRNMRYGQIVILGFLNGMHNFPVVLGHIYNLENVLAYQDNTPGTDKYENLDDYVIYHDETGAFMRFRTVGATPNTSPSGPGTAPQNGIVEITTDGGGMIAMTTSGTPGARQCALAISMPSGATVNIDAEGNMTTFSPGSISVTATDDITLTTGLTSITMDPVADKVTIQSGDPVQGIFDGANTLVEHITNAGTALPSGVTLTAYVSGAAKLPGNIVDTAVTNSAGLAQFTHLTSGLQYDFTSTSMLIPSGTFTAAVTQALTPLSGQIKTTVDGINKKIAHVAPEVGLGDDFANLPAAANAVNVDHLMNHYDVNKQAADLANFIKNANLDFALGIINGSQLAGKLTAFVSGWAASTTAIAGAAGVRIKST